MSSTPTAKEMGLIKHLSCRNGQLKHSEKRLQECIDASTKSLMKYGGKDAVKQFRIDFGGYEKCWDYTTIGEYTNKKGVVSRCHYTPNGKYYGSVKAKGDTPVIVMTYQPITAENFDKYWVVRNDGSLGMVRRERVYSEPESESDVELEDDEE
jgi:hypothetical protein